MKKKWHFRIHNDWVFEYPSMVNIELLTFHWENAYRWISLLGFSFILENYEE